MKRRALLKRREFMSLLGGVGVAGALGARARLVHAQQTSSTSLAVTELRAGLHLISGAGGNVVARSDQGAVLLVDSGSAESAPA